MTIGVSDEFFGRKRAGFTLSAGGSQAVGSLTFANGSAINDANSESVRIPRNGGESINVGAAEFTIEAWLRPSSTTSNNNQASGVGTGSSANNYTAVNGNIWWDADIFESPRAFVITLDGGRIGAGLVNPSSSAYTARGTTDLRNGNWHHVYFYRNATSGLFELGADGNREFSGTGPTGAISYNTGGSGADLYHYIAKEKANVAFGFTGDISMIRVSTNQRYSGATYTVPTAALADDANTVGLYYLDENTGTTMGDSSGDANHGTLVGSPVPVWSTADPF